MSQLFFYIDISKAGKVGNFTSPHGKGGRYIKVKGSVKRKKITIKEKLVKEFVNSDVGLGWFYNRDTGKMVKLDNSSLGGDHDGWIVFGDNAKKLGINPEQAKAYQAATFGLRVNKDSLFWKYAEKWSEDEKTGKRWADTNIYYNNKEFNALFKKHFGISIKKASALKFPQIMRIRLWKDNNIVVSLQNDNFTNSDVRTIVNKVNSLKYDYGLKVDKIIMGAENFDGEDEYYVIPSESMIDAKGLRALQVYKQ